MTNNDYAFDINKAIQFVGDNSSYQKKRFLWISIMLLSYGILNSFVPLTLTAFQAFVFFAASGLGQVICPIYFNIKIIARFMVISSLFATISIHRIPLLQTLSFGFLGFFGRGFYVCSFIYLHEIGGQKFRAWSSNVIFIVLGFSSFIFALIQMTTIPNWIWILLCITIPYIYINTKISTNWHEAPSKYCQVHDYKSARQVLNIMAAENKRPQFQYKLEGQIQQTQQEQVIVIDHKKYDHLDLIFMPVLKKITIPLLLLWFYRQLIYYGSFLILPELGDQQTKNLILLGVSEIVAALMSDPIKHNISRVKSFFIFTVLIFSGSTFLSFFVIDSACFPKGFTCFQKIMYRSIAMMIRFAISVIGSILINYTIEIYPQKIKNLGFGLTILAGSIGSITMPIFIIILNHFQLSPFIIFGVASILVIYLVPSMIETNGQVNTKRISELQGSDQPIINILW